VWLVQYRSRLVKHRETEYQVCNLLSASQLILSFKTFTLCYDPLVLKMFNKTFGVIVKCHSITYSAKTIIASASVPNSVMKAKASLMVFQDLVVLG